MGWLLHEFIERLDGRESALISRDVFPELYEAYAVEGFDLKLSRDQQCGVTRRGDLDLTIRFFADLIPSGADSTDPEVETGAIQRVIQTSSNRAHHHWFEMPEDYQGRGAGRRTLRDSVELYDALGIGCVQLTAVNVGTYTWAMCGFEFAHAEERQTVLEAADQFANELGYGIDTSSIEFPWQFDDLEAETSLREIAEVRKEVIKGSPRIEDLLNQPMRLGKALLLHSVAGGGWDGILRLGAESPGRIQMERYCGSS